MRSPCAPIVLSSTLHARLVASLVPRRVVLERPKKPGSPRTTSRFQKCRLQPPCSTSPSPSTSCFSLTTGQLALHRLVVDIHNARRLLSATLQSIQPCDDPCHLHALSVCPILARAPSASLNELQPDLSAIVLVTVRPLSGRKHICSGF